jgi:murein DD-endopeptidase MepM/ murein hydrolase activator NlpD
VGFVQNPFVGRVTSEFGPRNGKLHAGMDIAPPVAGTVGGRVFAAYAGKVVKVATKQKPGAMTSGRAPGRTGNGCVVLNPDGEKQVYNHMMPLVGKGDAVVEGQLLGHLDQSGQQSGPHLHFETWNSNGTLRDPRGDFRAASVKPGKGGPPIGRPFLPLRVDGDFAHRTITELERALARAGLYRGVIEEDRAAPAVAGPVLFSAYQKLLAARGFGAGRPDGRFGTPWVKAEQGWLHKLGFYKPSPPDGDRGKETIKALQRALNARAVHG